MISQSQKCLGKCPENSEKHLATTACTDLLAQTGAGHTTVRAINNLDFPSAHAKMKYRL